jgi:hypothetical protein
MISKYEDMTSFERRKHHLNICRELLDTAENRLEEHKFEMAWMYFDLIPRHIEAIKEVQKEI